MTATWSAALTSVGRVAKLYAYSGISNMHSTLLTPLFDPQVLRIDDVRITLIGIELSSSRSDDGLRVSEFMQVWRCSPLLDQTVAPPRR